MTAYAEPGPTRRRASAPDRVERSEPVSRGSFAVGELVAGLETPRCHGGENEAPAFTEQVLNSVRVALAERFGQVGEVEFDRSSATRLEVDERMPACSRSSACA
jgi:hypothetical protein